MQRRLFRKSKGKIIGGVSVGMGEYFDIDPVLIRILFVVLTFQGGVGILAYIILWIVVPMRLQPVGVTGAGEENMRTDDFSEMDASSKKARSRKRDSIAGSILVGLGLLLLADNLIPAISFENVWPVLLIAIGGGLLWNAQKKDMEE